MPRDVSQQVGVGVGTHPGLRRAANEDAFLAQHPVYIVADGMGGHDAGDLAAQAVVAAFAPLGGRADVRVSDVEAAVARAQADVEVLASRTARGAGSTLTGAVQLWHDEVPRWLILNVGDSRVYRASSRGLERLTVDHSLLQEQLDSGELRPEDVASYPFRNVITRAVGAMESPADYAVHPVTVGERLLICSDGLTNELSESEIYALLATEGDCQATADRLIERALEQGGRDNVTVIVVGVGGEAAAQPVPPVGDQTDDPDATITSRLRRWWRS